MLKVVLAATAILVLGACSSSPKGAWPRDRHPNQEASDDTAKTHNVTYEAKITYPFLKSTAANEKIVAAINESIGKQANSESCTFDFIDDYTTGFDSQTTPEVLTEGPEYYSFLVSGSNYCGGAHPNNGSYPSTYSLKTGKLLDLKKEFVNYDKSKNQIRDMYIAKVDKSMLGECKDSYEDFSYAFLGATNTELVVIASVPHAATPCAEVVKIPLTDIKSLLKKDSVLLPALAK